MHNRDDWTDGVLRFCDSLLVCMQMTVLMVFYSDEQKMTSCDLLKKTRIYWTLAYSINRVIHRLFYLGNALPATSGFAV